MEGQLIEKVILKVMNQKDVKEEVQEKIKEALFNIDYEKFINKIFERATNDEDFMTRLFDEYLFDVFAKSVSEIIENMELVKRGK